MILSNNKYLNELTVNEIEKKLLPFICVCDRIAFEDKPFLKGSRVVDVDFTSSNSTKTISVGATF